MIWRTAMGIWVFRQCDEPGVRERLFEEARQGRLRQGWSYSPKLSLDQDKSNWLREYGRIPDDKHKPEPTYRDLSKMLRIQPGDLIVVPKQPRDDCFFLARAIANRFGTQGPCYCFLTRPVSKDFRNCLTISPSSIQVYQVGDDAVPPILGPALFGPGCWYQSKINRVRRSDVQAAMEKLANLAGSSPTGRKTPPEDVQLGGGTGPLDPFIPLAESDYFQSTRGGKARRRRLHQRLVNDAYKQLKKAGARLVRKGRIDLFVASPREVIIEAKILRGNEQQAIREGIGQLLWYRFEQGLANAELCLLLDRRPLEAVLQFLEIGAGIPVGWQVADGSFVCGAPTRRRLGRLRWFGRE